MAKKKYYVIYKEIYTGNPDCRLGSILAIVESLAVAKDWCKRNTDCYYIERVCE